MICTVLLNRADAIRVEEHQARRTVEVTPLDFPFIPRPLMSATYPMELNSRACIAIIFVVTGTEESPATSFDR